MPALQASQSQTADFAESGTQTVTFTPYDTSLGPLTSVGLTVTSTVNGTATVQSFDLAPSTASVSLPGTFDVDLVGAAAFSPPAEVQTDATGTAALPAATSGAAPATLSGLSSSQSATFTLASATSDLSVFTGASPVTFTVAGKLAAGLGGSGNVGADIQSTGTATVTLRYNYEGPGVPVTIGTGSGSATDPVGPLLVAFDRNAVTTAPQTVTEPDRTTGWSDGSLTVHKFDPSLGTLESVNLALTGDASGTDTITNRTSAASAFSATTTATLALALPGQGPLTQISTLIDSAMLAPGEAATAAPTGGGTTAATLRDATDLAAFTGAGAVALNLSTSDTAFSFGPNDVAIDLATRLGAKVGVSYTYLPAGEAPDIVFAAECFAAGTRIATPEGDTCVESLVAGSCALTVSGRAARVVWVGRRHIDCRRHPRPRDIWPVRIRAHAFAEGVPRRDVLLSPDHAVFMDGVLIPVRHLADGAAVAQVPVDDVTYVHVELDRHDVLLADGLPAESYLDAGARAAFEGGPVVQAVPDFAARAWDAHGCAPLVVAGPEVDRVRAVLAARASAAAA